MRRYLPGWRRVLALGVTGVTLALSFPTGAAVADGSFASYVGMTEDSETVLLSFQVAPMAFDDFYFDMCVSVDGQPVLTSEGRRDVQQAAISTSASVGLLASPGFVTPVCTDLRARHSGVPVFVRLNKAAWKGTSHTVTLVADAADYGRSHSELGTQVDWTTFSPVTTLTRSALGAEYLDVVATTTPCVSAFDFQWTLDGEPVPSSNDHSSGDVKCTSEPSFADGEPTPGKHDLTVTATDQYGNVSTAQGTYDVEGTSFLSIRREDPLVAGKRGYVSGLLQSGTGGGLPGMAVRIRHRAEGGPWSRFAKVMTGRDGTFRYRLPPLSRNTKVQAVFGGKEGYPATQSQAEVIVVSILRLDYPRDAAIGSSIPIKVTLPVVYNGTCRFAYWLTSSGGSTIFESSSYNFAMNGRTARLALVDTDPGLAQFQVTCGPLPHQGVAGENGIVAVHR